MRARVLEQEENDERAIAEDQCSGSCLYICACLFPACLQARRITATLVEAKRRNATAAAAAAVLLHVPKVSFAESVKASSMYDHHFAHFAAASLFLSTRD